MSNKAFEIMCMATGWALFFVFLIAWHNWPLQPFWNPPTPRVEPYVEPVQLCKYITHWELMEGEEEREEDPKKRMYRWHTLPDACFRVQWKGAA